MALLMDGAADELEGRVSVVAIVWDDEVSREDAHRLTRAWAAKIGEKPVVAGTRIRCYGESLLEVWSRSERGGESRPTGTLPS